MAIDRKSIISRMSVLEIQGNEDGMIPAFGVLVNQLPASIWNSFAERLILGVPPELVGAAEYLLINAAHECGYHTGYGIINSEEWRSVVQPQIEKIPDDILHGAFAIFTAWGWARTEIVELVPNQRMVVRAYDYYERDSVRYGISSRPSAYMLRGVTAAFMDLAYGGPYDPSGKSGLKTFESRQTKGIECGDDYGEFVVERTV